MANDRDDRGTVTILVITVIVLLFLLWRCKNAAASGASGAGSLWSPVGTGEATSAASTGSGSDAGYTAAPTTNEDHSHLPPSTGAALPGHAAAAPPAVAAGHDCPAGSIYMAKLGGCCSPVENCQKLYG